MLNENRIKNNSDSLIELLTAQCADLEILLALARAETSAVEQRNFEAIFDIVSERSAISQRLETFQQQINSLRENLFAHEKDFSPNDLASRIIEIANLTLVQDNKTRRMLGEAREESVDNLQNLEKSQRGTNAYLQARNKGLAFDKKL